MREMKIIGDATNNLIKENFLDRKYRVIVDFRNLITHAYFGIDSDLISEKMSLSLNSIDKIGTMLGLAASSAFSSNYHIKKEDTASPWRKS